MSNLEEVLTKLGITENELEQALSRAKLQLFIKKGAAFIASILSQTEFIWDTSIPTACTNGLFVKFNPEFFWNIPNDSRVTVLAHEIWHIAYQHVLSDRIGGRDPEKWNIAADHVINIGLEKDQYSFLGIENCCKDYAYDNMGTEQVYSLLPDKPKSNSKGGQPDPIGTDIEPVPDNQQIDVMSKIVQAVQAARMSKDPGAIPGEIELYVDKFLNPKLPWEVLLRRFFTERANDDYSWSRPNRRYDDIYLPSLISEDGLTTINYYLDISGSISDGDIKRFNSEVASIKKDFNPGLLNLVTFDTRIRDIYSFTDDQPFEQIVVTGRGGTDLRPVHDHIMKTKPNVAVIFSDMYVEPMQPVGNIPVLWVVIGNPSASVSFGQMVHIDNE